ncbi:DNA-directed RNA polymerase I subunit RPA49-like [Trichoplusia ni]|uniref:DNA-directed RNA polymerase I subunit RPA49-like n=1 Tax=Trichoplusia ni TaxID=7111 RepID=A0A7E5V891_TRINI|nr:DNA-directed RNA polymerase I subunit RPA49-like [Trichoplusia ni]
MPEIQIDEVCPKEEVYPMIVNFQNGYATEQFKTNDCTLFQDQNTGKKTIVTELCDMLYTGEEEEADLGRTLILARNKTTGKVRLIEVENIELKPVLKSNLDTTELNETSYLELSRKFGSKKHKQIMEHREKLKVNVQTVTEQMQNVTDTLTEDQLDLSAYNSVNSDEFYIPTINRDAKKVEDVYDVDAILTADEYEKIYSEIEGTDYIKQLNPFLKSIATKTLSQTHTVLLVYADTLLKLYSTLMKDISKKTFTACPYSGTLNNIVMKNFLSNVNGKRGRSLQFKDKSLCYSLVFILLINGYKFNFDELCQQLKLTLRTVSSKVALTGATLVTVGTKKVAQLKLPLSRPALRRRSTKF